MNFYTFCVMLQTTRSVINYIKINVKTIMHILYEQLTMGNNQWENIWMRVFFVLIKGSLLLTDEQ